MLGGRFSQQKCLPRKHEDLSLDHRQSKSYGMAACSFNSSAGMVEAEGPPRSCRLPSLAKSAGPNFSERLSLKEKEKNANECSQHDPDPSSIPRICLRNLTAPMERDAGIRTQTVDGARSGPLQKSWEEDGGTRRGYGLHKKTNRVG